MVKKYNNLFNYAGSKIRVLNELKPILENKNKDILAEPFSGSLSLFLNTNFKEYHFNELNVDIYNLYMYIFNNSIDDLEKEYNSKNYIYDKENFLKIRDFYYDDDKNKNLCDYLYLLNNVFFGVSVNSKSSYGNKNNKPRFDIYKLFQEKYNKLDKKVYLYNLDYKEFIKKHCNDNMLIYCDPPYLDSFKYLKNNNAIKIMYDLKELSNNKNNFVISNYYNDLIKECYNDNNIFIFERRVKNDTIKKECIIY